MLDTSTAYKEAIIASRRRIVPHATVDLIDPDIVYGAVTSSGAIWYVDEAQLYDRDTEITAQIASSEAGYWLLNGAFRIAPDSGKVAEQTGYIVNVLSDEFGNYASPFPFVQMAISNVSVMQAATVHFSALAGDGIGIDFDLEIYSGDLLVYKGEVRNNKETVVYFDTFTVYDPTAMRLVFHRWSRPGRRPRIAELVPGIYERMSGSDIYTVDVIHQVGFDNMTISYGSAILAVNNKSKRWNPYAKNSIFKSIEARQPVPIAYTLYLPDGTQEEIPLGVFYQQEPDGWEAAANGLTMTFKLVDIVGLLKDRIFGDVTPPTTLDGWAAAIVGKLGVNFADRYIVDPSLASVAITTTTEKVQNLSCGNLLRYLCMATGAFFRADPATGYLRIEAFADKQGSHIGLGNMNKRPETKANRDAADITFKIGDQEYALGGNQTSSGNSLRIENPFITTLDQARKAAQSILLHFGGNKYIVHGRGDMSCEPGDIDTIETGFDNTVTGRRYRQQLKISKGIMANVPSEFLQADGAGMYENREEITVAGTWIAPAGVTSARLVLVGKGSNGTNGKSGDWQENGTPGKSGAGGKVFIQNITFNEGQSFLVTFGENTTFGMYTSSAGKLYPFGWGDLYTGEVYGSSGRDGRVAKNRNPGQAESATPGSGNGGDGGAGGTMGVRAYDSVKMEWVIKRYPGNGGTGGLGATGIAIIYYDKPEVT